MPIPAISGDPIGTSAEVATDKNLFINIPSIERDLPLGFFADKKCAREFSSMVS